MKKSILVFVLSTLSIGSYAATELVKTNTIVVSIIEEDNKTEIEVAKLPANVAQAISESHKGASIVKAFQVVNAENKVSGYEVVVKSADKEETLKFDANGALVK